MHNLISSVQGQQIAAELRRQMFDELKAQGDQRLTGDSVYYERMPYCDENHRNYYNRLQNGEKLKFPGWIFQSDVDKMHLEDSAK